VGTNRLKRLDLAQIGSLTFEEPDNERFPGLSLAYEAGRTGGTLPAVFNAANEVAVDLFLNNGIGFSTIVDLIARVMEKHNVAMKPTLETVLEADRWARKMTLTLHGLGAENRKRV
jgi:1-deoxy-D-xylulose-5-phosphate reductoisomerase